MKRLWCYLWHGKHWQVVLERWWGAHIIGVIHACKRCGQEFYESKDRCDCGVYLSANKVDEMICRRGWEKA